MLFVAKDGGGVNPTDCGDGRVRGRHDAGTLEHWQIGAPEWVPESKVHLVHQERGEPLLARIFFCRAL